ncbi:MAG: hypothetical protein RMK91_01965 [Pseudanabaenaceae cyanobacterium SKYGB_i_bin29]|nr:hypothetical protein [Pseudanabaenaceae cyanobacterium SKYG29]MDW8420615.1 hypothetical protein [Pseudanabaenaceae cyanobacterium SKYGB_i_bin29]
MAIFTVKNTSDSDLELLRQAIIDANAAAGANTIQFSIVSGSVITLTSEELLITDDVEIDGDLDNNGTADITVQRSGSASGFRTFNINDGNKSVFKNTPIDGLVIRGGSVSENGGGIYN